MGLFETLPEEPLERSLLDDLEETSSVQGIYPVYGEIKPNTAYGLVILLNGTLRAWAYNREEEEWVEIDEKEIENPVGGIPFDEQDTLDEFQNKVADEVISSQL